jgi:hypothetical protein
VTWSPNVFAAGSHRELIAAPSPMMHGAQTGGTTAWQHMQKNSVRSVSSVVNALSCRLHPTPVMQITTSPPAPQLF